MSWAELKKRIYYLDGSYRDLYVLNTDRNDWKLWINYVNTNYEINWFNGKTNKEEKKVDFKVIDEYWNGNYDLCSTAKVFIGQIQINAHFFDDNEIENDINPTEFNSIDDHYKLMRYMSGLSILLNKNVILTPENEQKLD